MATITFPYDEYLSKDEFLDFSKRFAKLNKKADPNGKGLIHHQDQIAVSLGYKSFALLHKFVQSADFLAWDDLRDKARRKAGLGDFIKERAVRTVDRDKAIETMRDWARRKYTPLIEFAFYDNESENGFGWPDVDMAEELANEFAGQYPDKLIQKVGNDLDVDEGPWGLEEYGE